MNEKMNEERKGEIAYQMEKLNFRKNFALRDIDIVNTKRRIGNLVIEPEMTEAKISKEELLKYGKILARDVLRNLEKQIAGL
ncbi:MAG: hypothetical protein Q8N73_00485 [bacterium]|nr:hypothetical protein [bacterium]